MILPILDYGDVFYHNNKVRYLSKLHVLQNNAICIIKRLHTITNTDQCHTELNLLDLYTRRNLHMIQFAYEISLNPDNLVVNAILNIRTRSRQAIGGN